MVKDSSIERRFSFGKGKDLDILKEVDKAEQKKDAKRIKQLLNKPKISDSYALALGRLSRQYTNQISNPTSQTKKVAKKKYSIILGNSYKDNLIVLGNIPKPIDIGEDFQDGIVKPTLNQILTRNGVFELLQSNYNWDEYIHEFTKESKALFPLILHLKKYEMDILYANGYTEFDIVLEFDIGNNTTGFHSTGWIDFTNKDRIDRMFQKTTQIGSVVDAEQYDWGNAVEEIVVDWLFCYIRWRKE